MLFPLKKILYFIFSERRLWSQGKLTFLFVALKCSSQLTFIWTFAKNGLKPWRNILKFHSWLAGAVVFWMAIRAKNAHSWKKTENCQAEAGSKLENIVPCLQLGLPSSLIRRENVAFRKRFTNRMDLKMSASRFRFERKHFENGVHRGVTIIMWYSCPCFQFLKRKRIQNAFAFLFSLRHSV